VYGAGLLLMIDGDSSILLDVMKVVFAAWFVVSRESFNQAHSCSHLRLRKGMLLEKQMVSKNLTESSPFCSNNCIIYTVSTQQKQYSNTG